MYVLQVEFYHSNNSNDHLQSTNIMIWLADCWNFFVVINSQILLIISPYVFVGGYLIEHRTFDYWLSRKRTADLSAVVHRWTACNEKWCRLLFPAATRWMSITCLAISARLMKLGSSAKKCFAFIRMASIYLSTMPVTLIKCCRNCCGTAWGKLRSSADEPAICYFIAAQSARPRY